MTRRRRLGFALIVLGLIAPFVPIALTAVGLGPLAFSIGWLFLFVVAPVLVILGVARLANRI
jgi:hypothetical protein